MIRTSLIAPATATSGQTSDQVSVESGGRASAAIRELASRWDTLRARHPSGPYASPGWMEVYAQHLASGGEPRLLTVTRGAELVGALPMIKERRRLAGVPARVLRSLSDDHSQRFDAVIADERVADAMLAHLATQPGWDVMELRELTANARAQLLVAAARRAWWPIGTWSSMRSPYLPLPNDLAELERGLTSRFRSNLRRRRKNLEAALGEIRLERIRCDAPAAELDAALDAGLALEAAGWKGEGGTGTAIQCDRALHARYRALTHAFAATGELAMTFLRAGDRRLSFHWALEGRGVYYLYKNGYDPSMSQYGTGQLLIWEVLRELIARDFIEFDFMGEATEWKSQWTEQLRAHTWYYLFRPSTYGRALHAAKFELLPRARRVLQQVRLRIKRP